VIADTLKTETLTADEEALLVELARERVGIAALSVPSAAAMDARERLIACYMPAISSAVRRSSVRSKEDLESELVISLLEMIADHDSSRGRLAARVNVTLQKRIGEYSAGESALTVPATTRDRFYNILFVRSQGDMSKALAEADAHPYFNRHTFLAVARALFGDSLDALQAESPSSEIWDYAAPEVDFERVELVDFLLKKLDPGTRLIIELFYGFVSDDLEKIRLNAGYKYDEELSDAQIAALEESPVHHRVSVNKRRNAGLRIMREALTLGEAP
jgi:hypothetical protein